MRRLRIMAMVAGLALAAAACSPADDAAAPDDPAVTPDDPVTTPEDTPPTPDDTPAAPDDAATPDELEDTPADDAVEIVGVDYAYQGVPSSVAAGTELTFRNDSQQEAHELVLVQLPDDEQRPIDELLQLPEEELAGMMMPNLIGVSVAAPGDDGMVVEGSLVVTQPGTYALLCFVPTGADPDEFFAAAQDAEGPPQVEGGPPHVANGMYATLTVD